MIYSSGTSIHNGKKIKNRKNKQKNIIQERKKHTTKTKVVADKKSGTVICMSFTYGKRHNFRLFKESNLQINQKIKILADTGFQGIKKFRENSEIPKKRFKKHKLIPSDKLKNCRISSQRVKIGNIIDFIKHFKIISEKYRSHRKRFSFRFSLISSIVLVSEEIYSQQI